MPIRAGLEGSHSATAGTYTSHWDVLAEHVVSALASRLRSANRDISNQNLLLEFRSLPDAELKSLAASPDMPADELALNRAFLVGRLSGNVISFTP